MAATTPTQLVRAAAPTVETTLYTNTSGEYTVISSVVLTNTNGGSQSVTLKFGGIEVFGGLLAGSEVVILSNLRQVLTGTETISAVAGTADVKISVSGVTVTP